MNFRETLEPTFTTLEHTLRMISTTRERRDFRKADLQQKRDRLLQARPSWRSCCRTGLRQFPSHISLAPSDALSADLKRHGHTLLERWETLLVLVTDIVNTARDMSDEELVRWAQAIRDRSDDMVRGAVD